MYRRCQIMMLVELALSYKHSWLSWSIVFLLMHEIEHFKLSSDTSCCLKISGVFKRYLWTVDFSACGRCYIIAFIELNLTTLVNFDSWHFSSKLMLLACICSSSLFMLNFHTSFVLIFIHHVDLLYMFCLFVFFALSLLFYHH